MILNHFIDEFVPFNINNSSLSQFVAVEGLITALVDIFPRHLSGGKRRELFTLFVCFVTFLAGLIFVTNVSGWALFRERFWWRGRGGSEVQPYVVLP